MSSTIHSLDRDVPPYLWQGSYASILKNGGTKFQLINQLRELISGQFRIVLKISKIESNLYVNGKPVLVRKHKHDKITLYPNVKILEGTDANVGGSNNYPHISFKEGYCVVEIITNGFPQLELDTYKMNIEILELEKL